MACPLSPPSIHPWLGTIKSLPPPEKLAVIMTFLDADMSKNHHQFFWPLMQTPSNEVQVEAKLLQFPLPPIHPFPLPVPWYNKMPKWPCPPQPPPPSMGRLGDNQKAEKADWLAVSPMQTASNEVFTAETLTVPLLFLILMPLSMPRAGAMQSLRMVSPVTGWDNGEG